MAYMYISGIYSAKTGVVLAVDESSYCLANGSVIVYVRNDGTIKTTLNLVTITGTKPDGTAVTGAGAATAITCGSGDLNPGAAAQQCPVNITGGKGTNTIYAGTSKATIYCP
jgi:hypothetical protein